MDEARIKELEKSIKNFINPLNDWAFKYIFGNKSSRSSRNASTST